MKLYRNIVRLILIKTDSVNHRADLNVVNSNGDTPLHLATKKAQTEVVEQLINAGAKVSILYK